MASTSAVPRRRLARIFVLAVALILGLFFIHPVILLDVAGILVRIHGELADALGPHRSGQLVVLGSFIVLFCAHVAEAAIWAVFLHRHGLVASLSQGVYFAAATTTLGYGDVVLPPPWRQLGHMIAMAGVLKFGCSAAFLFLVIQGVWARHLW